MARFSFLARMKSVGFAVQGIVTMLKSQHNAWLHLCATFGVISLGLVLKIKVDDWRWLISAIAMVWVAETTNTAIEYV